MVQLCSDLKSLFLNFLYITGELAQLARASALQAEGQGFKSPILQESRFERIDERSLKYTGKETTKKVSSSMRVKSHRA